MIKQKSCQLPLPIPPSPKDSLNFSRLLQHQRGFNPPLAAGSHFTRHPSRAPTSPSPPRVLAPLSPPSKPADTLPAPAAAPAGSPPVSLHASPQTAGLPPPPTHTHPPRLVPPSPDLHLNGAVSGGGWGGERTSSHGAEEESCWMGRGGYVCGTVTNGRQGGISIQVCPPALHRRRRRRTSPQPPRAHTHRHTHCPAASAGPARSRLKHCSP